MKTCKLAVEGNNHIWAAAFVALLATSAPASAADLAIGDTKLAYTEAGTGPVVLFLHGAVSDRRIWEQFQNRVSGEHRFVSYDQRYFGPADWSDEALAFSVATHAEDLAAVVDALEAGPVHLVTWSYGGLVGLHAAQRHPEKFRSMVYFEPTVESLHAGLAGERAAMAQKFSAFGPMAEALQRGSEKEAVRRLIEAVFRLETGAADGFPDDLQVMWDENARTLPPFLEAMAEVDPISCDDLSAISVPTLVMQGSDAYVLDAMMADEVTRCLANAKAVVLEDANHGGPVQQPEAFIDAVLTFVASES